MFKLYDSNTNHVISNMSSSEFVDALKMKWDDLHEKIDVFRYQIEIIHERLIDNKYLLQLNPNRGSKRRIPENFDNIIQPVDKEKFNFTKVADQEVLFTLTKDNDESYKHAILINVSPINRYHSLLCPYIDKCSPQVVTQESLKLAFEIMLFIDDREVKIGFNSLCAFASVNHLHYHFLFEHRILPVEIAKLKHIVGSLYILDDYVVPGFCFDVTQDFDKAAQNIFKLLLVLLEKSIPHNIFISWGSNVNDSTRKAIKVFIWPRKSCSGVEKLAAFSVAALELAGWFTMYDVLEFSNMQTEGLEDELRKWKYDEFDQLCHEMKSLY